MKNSEVAGMTKQQGCTYPKCQQDATVWYRWTDWDGRNFEMVCNDHAKVIRQHVTNFDGRGVMHNGIAEGAGR